MTPKTAYKTYRVVTSVVEYRTNDRGEQVPHRFVHTSSHGPFDRETAIALYAQMDNLQLQQENPDDQQAHHSADVQ